MGVERMLLLLDAVGAPVPPAVPDAYAVVPAAAGLGPAMVACETLRAAGVQVLMHAGGQGMKAQFKRADASGARWALVFGEAELARGEVALKALRDPSTAQRTLPLAAAADWAASLRNA